MTLAQPLFLVLLALLPGYWLWYVLSHRPRRLQLRVTLMPTSGGEPKQLVWALISKLPAVLLQAAYVAGVVALARPQQVAEQQLAQTQGIDIVLALDASESMLTTDLQPTRLDAAKRLVGEFLGQRTDDRIALVVFGAQPLTVAPLTQDYKLLRELLAGVSKNSLDNTSSAVGSALAVSLNRLKGSTRPSRIIILVTDGVSNQGRLDPVSAARLAAQQGVRIYPIAVGQPTYQAPALAGGKLLSRNDLDEPTLQKVADLTGGRFFRANDEKALTQMLKAIDQLEKTSARRVLQRQVKELYPLWLALAALCCAAAWGALALGLGNPLQG